MYKQYVKCESLKYYTLLLTSVFVFGLKAPLHLVRGQASG